MGILDGHVAGHQNVERDKAMAAGDSSAKIMEIIAALSIGLENVLDDLPILLRQGAAHQAGERPRDQPDPREDNIERGQDGNGRIEPQPVGQGDTAKPQQDRDGRPDIGHQVMAIRFQNDGTVLPTGPQQGSGHQQIERGCHDRNAHAPIQRGERMGIKESLDRGIDDAGGRQQDHRALEAAGKIFGRAVTERMLAIRRL